MLESALKVHATTAAAGISNYSRCRRQNTSGRSVPGVRSRPTQAGMLAVRKQNCLTGSTD
jgi:hypothetical protein